VSAPPPAPRPEAPSWRLVATLAGFGALAGAILVAAFQATAPAIQANKQERLRRAIEEVLGGPERYDTLYVVDGALVAEPPAGVSPAALERVYRGYAAGGEPVGLAIVGEGPGYSDAIRLIFGFDPARGVLLGMKVLESKETPGLGDKIEKDAAWVGQFAGAAPPLVATKAGAGDDPSRIDTITGATISSRAIVRIIDDSLARLGPALAKREASP
jgi:electron transport complex protein RnfG